MRLAHTMLGSTLSRRLRRCWACIGKLSGYVVQHPAFALISFWQACASLAHVSGRPAIDLSKDLTNNHLDRLLGKLTVVLMLGPVLMIPELGSAFRPVHCSVRGYFSLSIAIVSQM